MSRVFLIIIINILLNLKLFKKFNFFFTKSYYKYSRFMFKIIFILFLLFNSNKSLSFEIEEVANGVFVHFGTHEDANKSNKGDIANIGFILGKKSIMVIDTGGTKVIGKKLLEKIKTISDLPISHVVITHSHPDHFFGTEAFLSENPSIVGHEKLNRSLLSNFNFYKELQSNNIENEVLKNAKLGKANIKIKTESILKVDLGERIVEIKAWKSGHTDNDLSVYDLKTKTFWSENIFVDRIPSIRASILGWKKNLDEIQKMDIDLIVPGHGRVVKKDEPLKPILKYFTRLISQVRNFHENNVSLQESINSILQKEILDSKKVNPEGWTLFTEYHYSNVTKVYTELEWE